MKSFRKKGDSQCHLGKSGNIFHAETNCPEVGKEDWEDDEPRGLVLPRYLHDFDQLFDKSPTENGSKTLEDLDMEDKIKGTEDHAYDMTSF